MKRLLPIALFSTVLVLTVLAADPDGWSTLKVPGAWEEVSTGRYARHDGFAWYRTFVKVPADWKGKDLELIFQQIDDADETFVNGEKVGATGTMPPEFKSAISDERRYKVPAGLVRPGEYNLLAVRVYDDGGRGGIRGAPPMLRLDNSALRLDGVWHFRSGDDLAWAKWPDPAKKAIDAYLADAKPAAGHRGPEDYAQLLRDDPTLNPALQGTAGLDEALQKLRAKLTPDKPSSPADALKKFSTAPDLAVDLLLSEPTVKQPLWVTFDERGRMWVVQYIQYPFPAGLKIVSYDRYIRAKFDKVPPPPPKHFRGADKITIHEDTDGDGTFDKTKTFVDGLNIATSVLPGRGGVWVLNPPYLLFYPDKDRDDVPDGDPVVHLSGFGLEDTHAVANSLAWGPDGWIYGAQGSTCTAKVKVEITGDARTTDFLGQAIWRYHPERHVFELFAEGGGNTFGVEFDDQGRVYSGTNWSALRGLHYVQGGYYVKGWGKHGPLTNPYAYGFFPHMPHTGNGDRLTHTFLVYGGDGGLPERFRGQILGPSALQRRIQATRLEPLFSTFKTVEEPFVVTTPDGWFRPVDLKAGPDGALYVADMYEPRINHVDPRDNWDRTTGRIYRVRDKDAKPLKPFDLSKKTAPQLVEMLEGKDRWHRQTALRILGDRKADMAKAPLRNLLAEEKGQPALEALWGLYQVGAFDEKVSLRALKHDNPAVRLWAARLIGDDRKPTDAQAKALAALASGEKDAQVRSQLASTAKRLPPSAAYPVLRKLLQIDDDLADPHIPLLLWWAVEAHCGTDRDGVVALFSDPNLCKCRLVEEIILERLMQRFAAAGGKDDLLACARLLSQSPGPKQTARLLAGLEQAFAGGASPKLPPELRDAVTKAWTAGGQSRVALGLRVGVESALADALHIVADEKADAKKRAEYVRILGEVEHPRSVLVLLELLEKSKNVELKRDTLAALQRYAEPRIAERVLSLKLEPALSNSVLELLSSRPAWALKLLDAVEAGKLNARSVPIDVLRKLLTHSDKEIARRVEKQWGKVRASTGAEKQQEMERVAELMKGTRGDASAGRVVFANTCAKCHKLFGQGETVGPELTGYERDSLLFWLENVVDPSAAIRDEYQSFVVTTTDGRTLTGIIVEQNKQTVTLKAPDGQLVRLARDRIDELNASTVSLMPEDQLRGLSDQQTRDLFAYLMTKTVPK